MVDGAAVADYGGVTNCGMEQPGQLARFIP